MVAPFSLQGVSPFLKTTKHLWMKAGTHTEGISAARVREATHTRPSRPALQPPGLGPAPAPPRPRGPRARGCVGDQGSRERQDPALPQHSPRRSGVRGSSPPPSQRGSGAAGPRSARGDGTETELGIGAAATGKCARTGRGGSVPRPTAPGAPPENPTGAPQQIPGSPHPGKGRTEIRRVPNRGSPLPRQHCGRRAAPRRRPPPPPSPRLPLLLLLAARAALWKVPAPPLRPSRRDRSAPGGAQGPGSARPSRVRSTRGSGKTRGAAAGGTSGPQAPAGGRGTRFSPGWGCSGGSGPGGGGLRSARGWQQRGEPEEASASPVTFTNQLSLSEAGKQIPAPSRKEGQEAQSGRDTFIMFLGAAPLHSAGDKVTSLQPEQRRGGRFIQSDGNKKLQPTPRGLLTAQGSTCHRSDSRPVFARATCKTSSQPRTRWLGPGPGLGAASALPPGKGGHETQINTAFEGPSQPH